MATPKRNSSDGPTVAGSVDPKDSRAKRLERQQSRFRDRGGIFVPSNRNTLLDVLLARTTSRDSPRAAAASANAARRRSLSSSPLRRPSHTPRETPSIPRGRSSDVYANSDASVASPSRPASPGKVAAGSRRQSGKDEVKISKRPSAKRRGKSRASEAEQANLGAEHLRADVSSASEHESSTSKKPRPKAKASSVRRKSRLSIILESENESDAAVEPPPRKKSKAPAERSRSLSPESDVVVEPPARKKPKCRPKRSVSHAEAIEREEEETIEQPVRSSTSKGKGKRPTVSERGLLDDDEEPAVPKKAEKPSRATTSKKGSKKKQTAPPKASPLPDPPVPLDPDPGVLSKSRNDEGYPPKKARQSTKRQRKEEADAFEDPQPPRKRPKGQLADTSKVKPKKKKSAVVNDQPDAPSKKPLKSKIRQEAEDDTFEDPPPPRKRPKSRPADTGPRSPAAVDDEPDAPSKKPPKSKKRQQEEDTFEDPPRKRPKSQPADGNRAKPEKKSVATKDEPKGKIPSSKVLKENTADTNLPLKVANKPAKTKKPVSKRQKAKPLPKVIIERIQRSLNESHEVDDEPDPIDFLS